MTAFPYEQYRGTRLWQAISAAVETLVANSDLALATPADYVTGYLSLCVSSLPMRDDEQPFYHHGATLRIMGQELPIEAITQRLGIQPTHAHRRGDLRYPRHAVVYKEDMWSYAPPVPPEQEMEEHLDALYDAVQPHLDYLRELKSRWRLDVFCTYSSSSGTAGFQTRPKGLRLAVELDIPLGVSVVVV